MIFIVIIVIIIVCITLAGCQNYTQACPPAHLILFMHQITENKSDKTQIAAYGKIQIVNNPNKTGLSVHSGFQILTFHQQQANAESTYVSSICFHFQYK